MVKNYRNGCFLFVVTAVLLRPSVAGDQSSVAKIRLNSKINAFAKALFVKLLAF